MKNRFDADTISLLATTDEVEVETRRPDGRERRTIIWVMVDGSDVYLRSVRGARGKWYQELTAQSEGTLHVDGRRIPFRALAAADEHAIAACNEALRRKYEGIPGYEPMLRPDALETTLRLEPA